MSQTPTDLDALRAKVFMSRKLTSTHPQDSLSPVTNVSVAPTPTREEAHPFPPNSPLAVAFSVNSAAVAAASLGQITAPPFSSTIPSAPKTSNTNLTPSRRSQK